MALVRRPRRESGTLNKRVEIVSSYRDFQMGVMDAWRTHNILGEADDQLIDVIIDEMRDADSQIDAQRYAISLDNAVDLSNKKMWQRLPGGSADFGQEATSLTDTIFGDGYDSMFPGLITGSVTANAIIKGIPGYQVVIRQTGKPVSMQALMQRVPGTTTKFAFQSMKTTGGRTESPRFAFDLENAPTIGDFKKNDYMAALTNVPTSIEVDYLFGEVTFNADPEPGVATIGFTGSAVPLVTVGRAQNYNLTQTLNPVDETDFDTAQKNDGRRKFVAGLKSANLELSGFWRNRNNFLQQLNDREPVLMSIDPTGQGDAICRMYCFLMRQGQRGDVGALEEESVNFELNVIDDDRIENPVGWKFGYYKESNKRGGSIVSLANQMLLDAWLCGTHLGLRYLPNGNDKSDGKIQTGYTTAAIVTDASLSSSLDGVAEFQASFQLDGHVARRGQITRLVRLNAEGEVTNDLVISDDEEMIIELQDENGNPIAARANVTLEITGANSAKYSVVATANAAGIAGNVIPEGVARKTITIEHVAGAGAADGDAFTLQFVARPAWIDSDVKLSLTSNV